MYNSCTVGGSQLDATFHSAIFVSFKVGSVGPVITDQGECQNYDAKRKSLISLTIMVNIDH
jgi:hypothetical protein